MVPVIAVVSPAGVVALWVLSRSQGAREVGPIALFGALVGLALLTFVAATRRFEAGLVGSATALVIDTLALTHVALRPVPARVALSDLDDGALELATWEEFEQAFWTHVQRQGSQVGQVRRSR